MEDILNIALGFIPYNWQGVVCAVIALASAIAAATPTPKEGTILAKVYKILIDLPALNIGKAKDK